MKGNLKTYMDLMTIPGLENHMACYLK